VTNPLGIDAPDHGLHDHRILIEGTDNAGWTRIRLGDQAFRPPPLTRVAIVTLMLLPLVYGALYLWAFWTPSVT